MRTYLRGAIPTPRHKLLAATPHKAVTVPTSFLVVPKQLDMWGNDTYGDCVSAEEAFAKAAWSTYLGLTETFIPTQNVIQWARMHGYLNGANLTDVMDSMAQSGMVASDGKAYTTGPYTGCNYQDWATICSGIFTGVSLKIGVAASQIENAVNSTNGRSGWVGDGWRKDYNEDHCVGLCGYGNGNDLAALFMKNGINVSLPSDISPTTPCVALYTWDTIGLVTYNSILNIMGEAWVRNPVTPQQVGPPPPPPGPGTVVSFDSATKIITTPSDWKTKALAAGMPLEAYVKSKVFAYPPDWTVKTA